MLRAIRVASLLALAIIMALASFILVFSTGYREFNPPAAKPISKIQEQAPPSASLASKQLDCLTSTMWFEAGNQPEEGKIAVAEVVLKRLEMDPYLGSICAVVTQPYQFSFVRKGQVPRPPVEQLALLEKLAKAVVDGEVRSSVRGATHFHADYVNPQWRGTKRLGQIGDHIFYSATT